FAQLYLAVRVFFIIAALLFRRTAGADDPNDPRALGKTDQQELILGRMADDDLALFLRRVGFVIENRGERVGKSRSRVRQNAGRSGPRSGERGYSPSSFSCFGSTGAGAPVIRS